VVATVLVPQAPARRRPQQILEAVGEVFARTGAPPIGRWIPRRSERTVPNCRWSTSAAAVIVV
jgi:hypothetical protein